MSIVHSPAGIIIPALADEAPKTKAAEATAAEIFLFMLNLLKIKFNSPHLHISEGSLGILSLFAWLLINHFVTFLHKKHVFVAKIQHMLSFY